jgi:hypothetical protein
VSPVLIAVSKDISNEQARLVQTGIRTTALNSSQPTDSARTNPGSSAAAATGSIRTGYAPATGLSESLYLQTIDDVIGDLFERWEMI